MSITYQPSLDLLGFDAMRAGCQVTCTWAFDTKRAFFLIITLETWSAAKNVIFFFRFRFVHVWARGHRAINDETQANFRPMRTATGREEPQRQFLETTHSAHSSPPSAYKPIARFFLCFEGHSSASLFSCGKRESVLTSRRYLQVYLGCKIPGRCSPRVGASYGRVPCV